MSPSAMPDANILIAGFLHPRASRALFDEAWAGRVALVLCPYVVREARRMISRAFRGREEAFDHFVASAPHRMAHCPSALIDARYRPAAMVEAGHCGKVSYDNVPTRLGVVLKTAFVTGTSVEALNPITQP